MPALPNGSDGERSLKILVTGYGPFGTHEKNPSDRIASSLPLHIPSTSDRPGIDLIIQSPVRVSYSTVHSQIPKLLDEHKPDLVLHIGLVASRTWYSMEKSAPTTEFNGADVDGKSWTKEFGTEALPLSGTTSHDDVSVQAVLPGKRDKAQRLQTALNYDYMAKRCIEKCKEVDGADVRESDGVGAYLCGFVYLTSLLYFATIKNGYHTTTGEESGERHGPVLFLHVPPCKTDEDIKIGKQITIRLIESMAESLSQPMA